MINVSRRCILQQGALKLLHKTNQIISINSLSDIRGKT